MEGVIYLSNAMRQCFREFSLRFRNKETAEEYLSELRRFAEFIMDTPENATKAECKQYADALTELNAPRTVQKKLAYLSAIFSHAERYCEIYGFPGDFVNHFRKLVDWDNPKFERMDPDLRLTAAELETLLRACDLRKEISLTAAVVLAVKCMLTTSELCDLRISDVQNGAEGELILRVAAGHGVPERFLTVPEDIHGIVNECLCAAYAAGTTSLLSNSHGTPFTRNTLARRLQAVREQAGIEKNITFNMLRNTGICNCYAEDESLLEAIGVKGGRHMARYKNRIATENQCQAAEYSYIIIRGGE